MQPASFVRIKTHLLKGWRKKKIANLDFFLFERLIINFREKDICFGRLDDIFRNKDNEDSTCDFHSCPH